MVHFQGLALCEAIRNGNFFKGFIETFAESEIIKTFEEKFLVSFSRSRLSVTAISPVKFGATEGLALSEALSNGTFSRSRS